MAQRLRILGIVLVVFGLVLVAAGGVAYARTADGFDALQQFSTAQNVALNYNEDGQLVDRGTTEGAQAILTLLRDGWGYPVVEGDLNPDDPLVNTATEYMFQMATIGYHILHGTQTVVLAEDVEYNGEVFPAGEYTVEIAEIGSQERLADGFGGYWTDFDRQHPLEGPARSQAWSGTAHGLFGELGVGVAAFTSIQVGYALAGAFAALGLLSLLGGAGLLWAMSARKEGFDATTGKEQVPELV